MNQTRDMFLLCSCVWLAICSRQYVVKYALEGTQYERSFIGLYETIERLQRLAFFKTLISLQIMIKMKIIWIAKITRQCRVLE